VAGRVKSVLVIDTGELPRSMYASLERDGWICAHAPDLASARLMLHEVRPALVLVRTAEESSALRRDPLLAGVPLVLLGQAPGEIDALASRLDALVAASC
jgi:VpsR domain